MLHGPELMLTPLQFFKLIADDTRLRCVLLLCQQGELCVCELIAALKLSQPKISRHLALLRDAQVLVDRRQGQWVFYRLHPQLPSWALATLQQACSAQPDVLTSLLQGLSELDTRPQRCC